MVGWDQNEEGKLKSWRILCSWKGNTRLNVSVCHIQWPSLNRMNIASSQSSYLHITNDGGTAILNFLGYCFFSTFHWPLTNT